MRKFTLILLAVLLSLSLISCTAGETNPNELDSYQAALNTHKISTGTLTFAEGSGESAIITGYSCLATLHEVVIPDKIGDREISSIGEDAFYYCTAITTAKLPATVTSIDDFAFAGCTNLETIIIPANVTDIGDYAFANCTSLKSVVFLGTSVVSFGNHAFYGCESLETITLPNGLKSIGNEAFGMCSSITSLKMPSTLESIGILSFRGCAGLNADGALELSASIKTIGEFAFDGINKHYIVAPEGTVAADYVDNMAEIEED